MIGELRWWIWRKTIGTLIDWNADRFDRRLTRILRSRFIREDLIEEYVACVSDNGDEVEYRKFTDKQIVEDFDLAAPYMIANLVEYPR